MGTDMATTLFIYEAV